MTVDPSAPAKSTRAAALTFIHSADWQLGKPFAGLADPMKRARVQQERFEAIRRIGAVVRDRRASFVIVAGDLFDSPTPTHDNISAALGAIADLGVPVYAIAGNHDYLGPDSLWDQDFFRRERERLAPEFHLLDTRMPVTVEVGGRADGSRQAVLLPCPLLRRHEADDPTAWIRDLDFRQFGDMPRIVIAHGSTSSFASGAARHDDDDAGRTGTVGSSGGSNTIALDRLPLDEIDYVALGDWHGFAATGPKSWYSGTPEIDRFPKAGQEPGHVACVTVARGTAPTATAVRTGRFRWLVHDVALDASLAAASTDAAAGSAAAESGDGIADPHGPMYLDKVFAEATQPRASGEPGFDGCLADVTLTGTVSLAGRVELDHVIESWRARLLRLDLADEVRIAPTAAEIHDLTARSDDPIIARVATDLVKRLEAGDPDPAVRQGLFILFDYVQTSPTSTATPGATIA
jgi:hypothetical protein